MLPLPVFQHHRPTSLDEVLGLLSVHGESAMLIAGGTDLLPNMKHGLFEPEHLISLQAVPELRGLKVSPDSIRIGAMTSLAELAAHTELQRSAPALAKAVSLVGGPHHRRMGSIGGNVCLDTRCVYYNQTYFWRQALGFCLKKDGTVCHVVASGKNCVAAASNDSAPALMVLDASIELLGPKGPREVNANKFFNSDGINNLNKDADELVVAVRLPVKPRRSSGFAKLRRRGAIDYPLLNCAARIDHDDDGNIAEIDLVVSALAARPKRVKACKRIASGSKKTAALWQELAEAAYKTCKPLSNIDNDPNWRREMVRRVVLDALSEAAS